MPKSKTTTVDFEVGQRVSFEYDGNTTEAIITSVNPKKKVCDVETDENETLECDFDELTLVTKKAKPIKKKSQDEPEEEAELEKKSKKSSGTRSLTAAFKSAKPAAAMQFGLPEGNYECLVAGGEAAENDKGISAYIEYVAVNCDDSDIEGKSQRAFFALVDADGEPQQGVEFFKRDLLNLGIEESDIDELDDDDDIVEALNKLLKKLKKLQPWVSVTVKKGKGEYMNLYLQGLMDDQSDKPEMPDNFGN